MKSEANNLVQLLDNSTADFPRRIALVFGARRISYRQLSSVSKKLSFNLYDLGVRELDKVALWLPNCPEFVYAFFAILRLRATVVPVNTMLKREEAKFILEDSRAKILICSIDKIDDSQNILSRLQSLRHLISLPAPRRPAAFPGAEAILDFKHLVRNGPELDRDIEIKADDLAEIVYTSGTTGRPKGACLSHKNLVSNVRDCVKAINLRRKDCTISILPLFHSFSSTVCLLLPLSGGAKVVIMRAIRPFKRVIRTIFKHRVTVFVAVPSLYNILSEIKIPPFKSFLNVLMNPVRLCISGAAALPLSVCKKFERKFKRPLLQGYGLTEASPVVSLNPLTGKRKPDSVGLPFPSVTVKVVDKEGRDLPSGQVGELIVKGPNVMQGYYNLAEETKKALRGGWLYTGDLARIDADGFIYIMGRSKEMINVRGFNVYPREIEDLLYRFPHVKETAVVGVSHKHRGEVPVAFVVAETDLKEKDIIDYLRANIAAYKVPLKILFREQLPKNPTGKILKRVLQEEIKDIFE